MLLGLAVLSCKEGVKQEDEISKKDIEVAEKLFGLEFSRAERDSMLGSVNQNLESFKTIHDFCLENRTPPSLVFNPIPPGFRMIRLAGPFTGPCRKRSHCPKTELNLLSIVWRSFRC